MVAAIGECPASPREKQIHRIKMAAFKANVFKDDLYILCMSVWFGLEKDRFYVSYRLNQQLSQSGCTFLRNTHTGDLRES